MGVNPQYRVAAKSGGIFLRYGLEKTGMTSLGAGFINYIPPGWIKVGSSGPGYLLDIDSVPEAELQEVAKDVADWVISNLKENNVSS